MEQTRHCPYCDGEISLTARKCKHCGEWVEEPKQNSEPAGREKFKFPGENRSISSQLSNTFDNKKTISSTEERPQTEEETKNSSSQNVELPCSSFNSWILFIALFLFVFSSAVNYVTDDVAHYMNKSFHSGLLGFVAMLCELPKWSTALVSSICSCFILILFRLALVNKYPFDKKVQSLSKWIIIWIIFIPITIVFGLVEDSDNLGVIFILLIVAIGFIVAMIVCALKFINMSELPFKKIGAVLLIYLVSEFLSGVFEVTDMAIVPIVLKGVVYASECYIFCVMVSLLCGEESDYFKFICLVVAAFIVYCNIECMDKVKVKHVTDDDKYEISEDDILDTNEYIEDDSAQDEDFNMTQTLTGYIGKYPITMMLKLSRNSLAGYYYYDKQPNSIFTLEGAVTDDGFILKEYTADGFNSGHFELDLNLQGTFVNSKGQKFRVTLGY